jgi:hypothetical protein
MDRPPAPRRHRACRMIRRIVLLIAVAILAFGAGRASAAPREARLPLLPVADGGLLGAPLLARSETGPREASETPAVRDNAGRLAARHPISRPTASSRTPSATLTGTASWYSARGLVAAAGPALRVGHWRGTWITVSANGRSVRVQLVTSCQCYGSRLLDLGADAFRRLAPLSQGLVRVSVER